jgi:hypothetical protein
MKDYKITGCVYRDVYQDKHTGEVTYGKWLPCGNSSSGGNNNMGNNGRITTSSGWSGGGDRYRISNPFNTKPDEFSVYSPLYKPQIQPYVRPEFVPYTQPANSFLEEPKYIIPIIDLPLQESVKKQQVLEKQITVGKVLSEADKYGLNSSVYQQQVNTMSDYELSKQYQEWKALEKRILVGKVLTQYSEATGKSIDEIDEQTKSYLNNADQASLEKIYNDNIKNKQVVLVGTILSQVNQISGKPLNELDQETIDFVNNSELATLQLIYNTNVNQKQLLAKESTSLYELYLRLPVNVSYNILYNPGYFNSDINKLLTRQLDLKKISNLNLTNNQIADDGAKVIADSLAKGEMPNLKKLHLEGNKITDDGQDALINALKNETVQDVIITAITLYEKYQLNISGNKEKQRSILENQLERAKAHGIDVDKVVVDNTTKGWIEHKGSLHGSISFGWAKCMITYDDVRSFAGERLIAKVSKKASVWNDLTDAVLCYFKAENEVSLTEEGVRDAKYQLEGLEKPELIGNIEAWYEVPYL